MALKDSHKALVIALAKGKPDDGDGEDGAAEDLKAAGRDLLDAIKADDEEAAARAVVAICKASEMYDDEDDEDED